MRLTGKDGAELNGTLQGREASAARSTSAAGHGFTAAKAVKPSGLYRATAEVRGAKIDGGWIVLPDGRQVGILNRDGKPAAAPRIDPADRRRDGRRHAAHRPPRHPLTVRHELRCTVDPNAAPRLPVPAAPARQRARRRRPLSSSPPSSPPRSRSASARTARCTTRRARPSTSPASAAPAR